MNAENHWISYYTPVDVASEVIANIPNHFRPVTAIDICVGSGNFLRAAKNRWPGLNLIGVDQNISTVNQDLKNEINLYQQDAYLYKGLKKSLNCDFRENLLLVANPPFGKLENAYAFFKSRKQCDFFDKTIDLKRKEALMLYSNLSLLKEGDYFAAILPDNIFRSDRFYSFKCAFLNQFKNEWIGEPSYYFKGSEVRCRMFVGEYKGLNSVEKKIIKDNNPSNRFQAIRGVDNSKIFKRIRKPNTTIYEEVVHFSNTDKKLRHKFYTLKETKNANKYVEEGDVLISRVGRNAGMVTIPTQEFEGKLASDYFFIYKGLSLSENQVKIIQEELFLQKRGLTTSYLTKSDINEVLLKQTQNVFY